MEKRVNVIERSGRWFVFLPHQCDEWMIAGGDTRNADGAEWRDAVRELFAFKEEVDAALRALIEKRTECDEFYHREAEALARYAERDPNVEPPPLPDPPDTAPRFISPDSPIDMERYR